MKLRIAKKIWNTCGGPRWDAYTQEQQRKAQDRYDRSPEAKEIEAYWDALMTAMGTLGRMRVINADAGRTFERLMEEDEKHWHGDDTLIRKMENA